MPKIKIYIGCSLTYASPEFISEIDRLKARLQDSCQLLNFVGLETGTIDDVYRNDTRCVRECDLFVAECSYPSSGLGLELELAVSLNKPILAVAKKDAKVSRMVLGIDHPLFTFSRYESIDGIVAAINAKKGSIPPKSLYISHSRDFDFINELYGPLERSSLAGKYKLILPHRDSAQGEDTHSLLKSGSISAVIAETSRPSTGQGIELGWASQYGIPVICTHRESAKPANSLKRISQVFIPYQDTAELVRDLETALSKLNI